MPPRLDLQETFLLTILPANKINLVWPIAAWKISF